VRRQNLTSIVGDAKVFRRNRVNNVDQLCKYLSPDIRKSDDKRETSETGSDLFVAMRN
jgi:hypothetical protein